MHRSSHVNGVQGEQKRILDERHKCVCYFGVPANTQKSGTNRPIAASYVSMRVRCTFEDQFVFTIALIEIV